MVSERDDQEQWASIVANYGDRAELIDDDPVDTAPETPATSPSPNYFTFPDPADPADPDPGAKGSGPQSGSEGVPVVSDDESFVPPTPPPLPRPDNLRLAAWIGVLGTPVALLVLQLADLHIAPLLGYAMVTAFLGGFGFLVAQMPSGPRDPDDDGARV